MQHRKLYRFAFQLIRALVSSVGDNTRSITNSGELCELWHKRMAHLHHGAFSILRQITTGVSNFSIEHCDVCRGCAMGKYTKAHFPARDNNTSGILDLVHSDVSGKMSHDSLRGYEYYVIFIDDFSKET